MHAFLTSSEISCSIGKFYKTYAEGKLDKEVPVDQLIIDTGGESGLVRKALELAKGEEEAKKSLHFVTERQLLAWPGWPAKLGRYSAKIVSEGLHEHLEPAPLRMQCEVLKRKQPAKKHFRIAVVNGFGTNLGDNLLGMSAMRQVAKVMDEVFDSFAVDFLLGPQSAEGNQTLVCNEDWVGLTTFQSPTLQKFAQYDAYIDYSSFLTAPRFNEIPTADWHLWWMGLSESDIDHKNKRNELPMPWTAWMDVAELLKSISGRKILFNHKASVPLRTFPDDIAIAFLRKMLEKDTDLKIIVAQPLEIKHPRVVDLSKKLPSTDHFSALVAQMQGVVCVDTFAVHVADAASVPSVTLFSSIPSEIYPYYPLNRGMMIPDAENLPAYRKSKLADEKAWKEVEDAYRSAWKKLSASAVLKSLKEKTEERLKAQHPPRIRFIEQNAKANCMASRNGTLELKHAVSTAIWDRCHVRLAEIAKAVLKPGMDALQLGAGRLDVTKTLLTLSKGLGRIHVFEPRRPFLAALQQNFSTASATGHLALYAQVPVAGHDIVNLPISDPFSELDVASWGNSKKLERVRTLTMDALELTNCKLVLMQPPFNPKQTLQSGEAMIRKNRPTMLVGPVNKDDLRAMTQHLFTMDYDVWVEQPLKSAGNEEFLAICFPQEQPVKLQGFAKVQVN